MPHVLRQWVDLVHETFFIRTGKRLIAQCGFGPLFYPTGIRVSAEVHLWIIRCFALGPIFGRVDMGARAGRAFHQRRIDDRGLSLFQLQPVAFDLTAHFGQQVVVNTAPDQCVAEPAVGCLIRHPSVQIKPAENHEVQTHLQRPLQLWIAQPVPLADQQALEQDQWIIPLRTDTGSPLDGAAHIGPLYTSLCRLAQKPRCCPDDFSQLHCQAFLSRRFAATTKRHRFAPPA